MTHPRVDEVAWEVLGEIGSGPTGYSAAREWGVTTQIPALFHVATLWPTDPIVGVTQHSRRNRERATLTPKEIALLELLRAPDVCIEAGWGALVERVRDAFDQSKVLMALIGFPRLCSLKFPRPRSQISVC